MEAKNFEHTNFYCICCTANLKLKKKKKLNVPNDGPYIYDCFAL